MSSASWTRSWVAASSDNSRRAWSRVVALDVRQNGTFREILQDTNLLAPGDDVAQPRPQNDGREQRPEHDGHKDRLCDHAIFQGQQSNNDLHGSPRRVRDGNGRAVAAGDLGEHDPQPCAQVSAAHADDGHEGHEQPIEMAQKIDLQPDSGEEKRNEHGVDHLRDDLTRPLGEFPGFARHNPGEEEPEQRVDADPVGNRPAQDPKQDDERQRRTRLRHFTPLDLAGQPHSANLRPRSGRTRKSRSYPAERSESSLLRNRPA